MVVNDAVNEQRATLNHKVERKTTKQMKNSVSRCNYNKHITLKLIDIANTRVAIYQLLIQTHSDYSIAKFKKLKKKSSAVIQNVAQTVFILFFCNKIHNYESGILCLLIQFVENC